MDRQDSKAQDGMEELKGLLEGRRTAVTNGVIYRRGLCAARADALVAPSAPQILLTYTAHNTMPSLVEVCVDLAPHGAVVRRRARLPVAGDPLLPLVVARDRLDRLEVVLGSLHNVVRLAGELGVDVTPHGAEVRRRLRLPVPGNPLLPLLRVVVARDGLCGAHCGRRSEAGRSERDDGQEEEDELHLAERKSGGGSARAKVCWRGFLAEAGGRLIRVQNLR